MNLLALPSPCRPALATVERGSRQLTDEERTQLTTAARFARHTGTVSMKDLAREWKISPTCLYDLINRQRTTGSAAALPRSGRPNALTDADEALLAELSEELDGNYTWDEITKRFNEETGKKVCTMTVFRFCKSRAWREVCDKLVPCLKRLSLALSRDKKVQKFARARFSRHVQYCGASQVDVKFCNPR